MPSTTDTGLLSCAVLPNVSLVWRQLIFTMDFLSLAVRVATSTRSSVTSKYMRKMFRVCTYSSSSPVVAGPGVLIYRYSCGPERVSCGVEQQQTVVLQVKRCLHKHVKAYRASSNVISDGGAQLRVGGKCCWCSANDEHIVRTRTWGVYLCSSGVRRNGFTEPMLRYRGGRDRG